MPSTYRDLIQRANWDNPAWTFAQLLDQQRFDLHFKYHLRDIHKSLSNAQDDLNRLDLVSAFHHSIVLSMLYELICPSTYAPASERFQQLTLRGCRFLAQFHPAPAPEKREDIDFEKLSQACVPHVLKVVVGWLDHKQLIHAHEVAGLYMLFNEFTRARKATVSSVAEFETQVDAYLSQVEQNGIQADHPFAVIAERFS